LTLLTETITHSRVRSRSGGGTHSLGFVNQRDRMTIKIARQEAAFPPEGDGMRKLTRTLLVTGSIALALALWPMFASRSSVMKAAAGCTNRSLKGAYALAINGLITLQTPPRQIGAFYPVAVSGTLTFDGVGNVSRAFVFSFAGVPSPVADSGTYQVNPDCTASANFPATGETFDLVVVDKQTATFINATTGAVGAGTLLRQRHED